MKSEWFAPNKSFLALGILWIFIGVIGAIALVIYIVIYAHEGGGDCYSANCINSWVKDYQVPLGVLALLIPIIGLLNANHKSEQAREALDLSKSQNLFSNYYKHVEEFVKYSKTLEDKYEDYNLKISTRNLHTLIFPYAKAGDYKICEKWIKELKGDAEFLIKAITNLRAQNKTHDPEAKAASFEQIQSFYDAFIRRRGQVVKVEFESTINYFMPDSTKLAFEILRTHMLQIKTIHLSCSVLAEASDFEPHEKTGLTSVVETLGEHIKFLSYASALSQLERNVVAEEALKAILNTDTK